MDESLYDYENSLQDDSVIALRTLIMALIVVLLLILMILNILVLFTIRMMVGGTYDCVPNDCDFYAADEDNNV